MASKKPAPKWVPAQVPRTTRLHNATKVEVVKSESTGFQYWACEIDSHAETALEKTRKLRKQKKTVEEPDIDPDNVL